MSITGRRRYRVGGLFRNKLILQVEYRGHVFDGGYGFDEVLRWRDATVEDIMLIQAEHQPFEVL